MIVTNLNSPELKIYENINPYFAKVFELAKEFIKNPPESGRYTIDGNKAYYMIQTYPTKPVADAKYETHEKYIDIQIILRGEEEIRFETLDKLTEKTPYNPEKDIAFWNMTDEYDSIRLGVGELAIIFPNDPHGPALSLSDTPSDIVKFIAKIAL